MKTPVPCEGVPGSLICRMEFFVEAQRGHPSGLPR